MRKAPIIIILLAAASGTLFAESDRKVSYGLHALFGARYDNLRMCVGSDAGVKGGPIIDLYFDVRFPTGEKGSLVLNIPVMRPILFAAAFDMLQFEPQLTYEHRFGSDSGARPVLGAGLGAIFHYGPDYRSDADNRGEDFFAAGPLLSLSFGVEFSTKKGAWMPGLKVFYAPLFSADYPTGTVAGGGLELHYSFN